eukprot:CAMPEP_0201511826 /NCGR_PEP_ID=MMETSP0161_2-20130828/4216_1 /ASSEMBLY_ACC=CAM_ASM_000251 /TAXON_ID=180227 /ORGANISM="Neoparamoeba aestuarina, Strain SoJaBio B1-5/56/2" /LENGTH=402 /DNA_ID=CAMNT_0047907459 /DNA_START=117 /DNA_END=1325 /DNA_ORIENTATION=-
MVFGKKKEKTPTEELPTDDYTYSEELSETDLAEFAPRDRDLEEEQELLASLPSQRTKAEKEYAMAAMKYDLFQGGSEDPEEWKKRAEKRKKAGLGEGQTLYDPQQQKDRDGLMQGASGKEERLAQMKKEEQRRKRREEEKAQMQRRIKYGDAELGVGGIDEDVGRMGTRHTIQFDSDESDEDYMTEEQKRRKKQQKIKEQKEKERREREEAEAREAEKGKKKKKKKEKKKKEKEGERRRGEVEERRECEVEEEEVEEREYNTADTELNAQKRELFAQDEPQQQPQQPQQPQGPPVRRQRKPENEQQQAAPPPRPSNTSKPAAAPAAATAPAPAPPAPEGEGAIEKKKKRKKKKKAVDDIDIFDDDAWDAMMSKPLSCTTAKPVSSASSSSSAPPPQDLDEIL